MEDVMIILSALWIALMLTSLLGDVLRIFRGNFTAGEIGGKQLSQGMGMLPYPMNRWANIIVAIFFFGLNLVGLPTYSSTLDKFFIIGGRTDCLVCVELG